MCFGKVSLLLEQANPFHHEFEFLCPLNELDELDELNELNELIELNTVLVLAFQPL